MLSRAGIITDIEELEIKFLAGAGFPQAKHIDRCGAITGNEDVGRFAKDLFRGEPARAGFTLFIGIFFSVAAKAHFDAVIGLGELPGVAIISQSSGLSTCQPSLNDCWKMPNS